MSNQKPVVAVHVIEDIVIKDDSGDLPRNQTEAEHPELISPAHAVPSSNIEGGLSDDDGPKVILTLDTVANPCKPGDIHQNYFEISGLKADEANLTNKKNGTDVTQQASKEITELARKQLQQLERKRRNMKTQVQHAGEDDDPLRIAELSETSEKVVRDSKRNVRIINTAKSKNEKEIVIVTQNDGKKRPGSGAKKEVDDDDKNDDLIAILEGAIDENADDAEDESIEEYELVTVEENEDAELPPKSEELSKEEMKKIAAQQLMSIPNKQRGRRPKETAKTEPKPELVRSLVSDWSDTEKDQEMKTMSDEKKVVKKKEKENTEKPTQPEVVPFRRTRVIKKKIIWDPDAPETQFSYASLVQSSAKKSTTKKLPIKPVTSTPKPTSPPTVAKKNETKVSRAKNNESPAAAAPAVAEQKVKILNTLKRRSETPPSLLNKKKKVSEVDRLLRDEGVANMVQALESETAGQKESRTKKNVTAAEKVVEQKKEITVKKRGGRQVQQSPDASWDYIYNQQRNDDSLIIRRRSNSSYSSTSPRRLSLDHTPVNPPSGGRQSAGSRTRNFQFAKPDSKKISKNVSGNTSAGSSSAEKSPAELRKSTRGNSTPEVVPKEGSSTVQKTGTELMVKRHDDVVQLILKPKHDNVKNTFTPELMKNIVTQLTLLQKDNTCKVVFLTATGPHFCQGVDFIGLTQGAIEKRRQAAQELANCTKNLLVALASFTKPLIAGITGACVNLGVTILPLFDVVIASDKCTFETPYAKIGQLPEGYCILSSKSNIRHNFKTKLIYLCEKLNATEAALGGLVAKIEPQGKLVEETLLCAKKIASFSQQTFASVKSQNRKEEMDKFNHTLDEEFKTIVQHWTSSDCLEKFKNFINSESW